MSGERFVQDPVDFDEILAEAGPTVHEWLVKDEFSSVSDLLQTVCAYYVRRDEIQDKL